MLCVQHFGSDTAGERLPLCALCTAFGSDTAGERLPLCALCTAFGSDTAGERLPLCPERKFAHQTHHT